MVYKFNNHKGKITIELPCGTILDVKSMKFKLNNNELVDYNHLKNINTKNWTGEIEMIADYKLNNNIMLKYFGDNNDNTRI